MLKNSSAHFLALFIVFISFLLSSCQDAAIANAQNLLNNPGFESGTSGWSSDNSTIVSSTTSFTNKASILATNRNANWAGPGQDISSALQNNGKGEYNLQAYVKLSSGSGTGRIIISISDDAGQNYHSVSGSINADNFNEINGVVNLNWTGTLHSARLHVETGRETTAAIFVDDVVLSITSPERPTNDQSTSTTAFYSYQSDLSNPQPLKDAILEPRQTYFFITNNELYKRVSFYCCKGIAGEATGEPHSPVVADLTAPYSFSHDTTNMATGVRELYFDSLPTAGGIENHAVYFTLAADAPILSNNLSNNKPPVISGSPANHVEEGSPFYFQPSASDVDDDALSFSIAGQPSWSIFDSNTGRLSGVPTKGEAGIYKNIVISVADGTNTTRLPAFNIQVEAITANEQTINTTVFYSYQSDLSSPQSLEGAVLQPRQTYFFTTNNGQYKRVSFYCCKGLTGDATGEPHSPAVTDATAPYGFSHDTTNMASGIRELYFDSLLTAGGIENHTIYFSLAAAPPNVNKNTAPEKTTNTTAFYSYQSDLSNPQSLEGAVLQPRQTYFFITNNSLYKAAAFYCCKGLTGDAAGESHAPSIIDASAPYSFSRNTADMKSGTRELYYDTFPTAGGIESHTVNFSVAANSAADITIQTGSFTVKWIAPSERADGSVLALSDIAGYTVHYGLSRGNYSKHIKLNDHSAVSKVVNNIPVGTYHVALTTQDTGGRESDYSSEIVITVQ